MSDWKGEVKAAILAEGTISLGTTRAIQRLILGDKKVSQDEIDFLLELRNKTPGAVPEFHQFVFSIIQRKILPDNEITARETAWLIATVFADGQVDAVERQFLKQLKDAALLTCPEFDALCAKYESV